jgi:hypothetical protein
MKNKEEAMSEEIIVDHHLSDSERKAKRTTICQED